MRSAWFVTTLVLLGAAPALAADLAVRPGDKVKGVIAPGGGDRISLEAPAGGRLGVKIKGSGGLLPALGLLDRGEPVESLSSFVTGTGRRLTLGDFPLPSTGPYTLLVSGSGGTGGAYKLSITVDLPGKIGLTSPAPGTATVAFDAFGGSSAKIKVSRVDGDAEPEIVGLEGPAGPVTLPPADAGNGKVSLRGVLLPQNGRYTLTARPRAGTSGTLKLKIKLDAALPKAKHVLKGASVAGSILVPEPDSGLLFEQEPNDTIASAQLIGEVSRGTSVAIAGITDAFFHDPDVFRFVVRSSLEFQVALGLLDGTNDFDAYVYTYEADGTPVERLALDGTEPIEAGSFDLTVAPGDYEVVDVVVEPFSGFGIYVLAVGGAEISGLSAASRAAAPSRPAAGRTVEERLLRRALRATALDRHFRPFDAEFRTDAILVEGRQAAPADGERHRRRLLAGRTGDERGMRLRVIGLCARAAGEPGVVSAQPIYRLQAARTSDDDLYGLQWHYRLIGLPEAWDVTTGSPSIVVAVVDTGVKLAHPDLAANLTSTGYDLVSSRSMSNDGDGIDPNPDDPGDDATLGRSSYHGTHVAGTVAAVTDNGRGVAGVAWNVKVMPVRVLGIGGGDVDDIAQGIRYAAGLSNASGQLPAQPARIINLSLGGHTLDDRPPAALRSAIQAAVNAGVLVVCAAGNENTSRPSWPAALPECISVSSVNAGANRAPYSNFGSTIDIAAPGGETGVDRNGDGHDDGVLSTLWDDVRGLPDYASYQGTSMASPHVAGVAALVLSVDPALGPSAVRTILEETARDLGSPGVDSTYGHGLVDARAAVLRAASSGGGPAALTVSRTSVGFGRTETVQTVLLGNAGSDPLTISGVTNAEETGGDWLSTSLSSTTAPAALTLTARRTGLPAGTYQATVTVTSSGGGATIQVSLEIGSGAVPDVGTIGVFLLDPWLGRVVDQVFTSAAAGYAYRLDAAPGAYYLVAASDDDGNGIFGEAGELLGAWPVLSQASILSVGGGDHPAGLDFAVSRDEDLGFARAALANR